MTMTTATHINPKNKSSQVRMMCILKWKRCAAAIKKVLIIISGMFSDFII